MKEKRKNERKEKERKTQPVSCLPVCHYLTYWRLLLYKQTICQCQSPRRRGRVGVRGGERVYCHDAEFLVPASARANSCMRKPCGVLDCLSPLPSPPFSPSSCMAKRLFVWVWTNAWVTGRKGMWRYKRLGNTCGFLGLGHSFSFSLFYFLPWPLSWVERNSREKKKKKDNVPLPPPTIANVAVSLIISTGEPPTPNSHGLQSYHPIPLRTAIRCVLAPPTGQWTVLSIPLAGCTYPAASVGFP